MDAMIVVDMQAGLQEGAPKHDLPGVIDRINAQTAMVRRQGGRVIRISHCGRPADGFEPGTPGWEFLPALITSWWSPTAIRRVIGRTSMPRW